MNLLSFANSSFFFSLRKITQLNSQQPKLEDINRSPWFELYSRWKWSTYLVCTVWASGKLLMRRDHLTLENNISSDSARNSVITCNYVKLRHVSHTPEHGNIARRAEGSWFLSSWYDVPLSLSQLQDHTKDSGVQVFVQIISRAAAAMNPQRNLEIQLKGEIVPTEFPTYLYGSLQNPFWRLSMIVMVQTQVHFENGLRSHLRL